MATKWWTIQTYKKRYYNVCKRKLSINAIRFTHDRVECCGVVYKCNTTRDDLYIVVLPLSGPLVHYTEAQITAIGDVVGVALSKRALAGHLEVSTATYNPGRDFNGKFGYISYRVRYIAAGNVPADLRGKLSEAVRRSGYLPYFDIANIKVPDREDRKHVS